MDLLNDKIETLYVKFLFPSFFAATVSVVYTFVDMIAIGRGIGPDGSAASAITFPIMGVASFFGFLCGIGGSVHLGKARGEGKPEKANAYYTASLLLEIVLTTAVWMLALLFKKEIFTLFGASEALMPLVLEYGDWVIRAFPCFILSVYLSCIVRSDGSPNVVMAAVVTGAAFNIFGDWFLVFPMHMGMKGAALATVGGNMVQVLILCGYFFTKNNTLRFVMPGKLLKAFYKLVVAGFSASLIAIGFIVLTSTLNTQIMRYGGEVPLSVFGVVLTCSAMFQNLFMGVGQAIQPIATTNYGAGKIGRICRLCGISAWTVVLTGVCFTLLGLLFPVQIIRFFMAATPEVIEAAPAIIRTYFISFLFMGINMWAIYYLQSIMRPRTSTLIVLLRGIIISSVLLNLLPALFENNGYGGIDGVWWAMVLTEAIVAAITLIFLKQANRKLRECSSLQEEQRNLER